MKVLHIHELSSNRSKKQLAWRWLERDLDPSIRWTHIFNHQFANLQQWTRHSGLIRTVMILFALFKGGKSDLAVTHGIHLAASYGFAKRIFGIRTTHLAWAFSIVDPSTISPLKRWYYRFSLKDVDRFVMFSSVEIGVYSRLLNLPEERFQMVRWTANKPELDPEIPNPFAGNYIAAMGGEGRDYATLFTAMQQLPDMKLVVVASPESVAGLKVPDNVELLVNQPVEYTFAIARNSDFMLLPTVSSDAPCGHSTLVTQFLMGKASIVTESSAMADYVAAGVTALTFQAGDVASLVTAIQTLATDREMVQRLAENGEKFAQQYCSEETAIDFVRNYLLTVEERLLEPDPEEHEIAESEAHI